MIAYRAMGNACRVLRQLGASTSGRYGISIRPISTNVLAQRNIFPTTGALQFRRYSTKTETTLADFLKEEIEVEKKLAKQQLAGSQPDIPGFQVKTEQREVILSKQHGSEKITVTFDVNHTVDADDDEPESNTGEPQQGNEQPPVMVSKPNFTVQVEKGDQKLVFECVFVEPDYGDGTQETADYGDPFNIEEVYIYSGELTEKNKIYATSGGIIDGTLYDHLMNYLEERGINGEFANNLCRYATYYEHSLYVSLLQKLRDFVSH